MGAGKSIVVWILVMAPLGLGVPALALEPEQIVNLVTVTGIPSLRGEVRNGFPFREQLLFLGIDDEHGVDLWRTDGTAEGTEPVLDRCPELSSGLVESSFFEGLPNAPVRFFQAQRCGAPGIILWSTDGTTSGTRPLLEIESLPADSPHLIVGEVGDTGRLLLAKGPSFEFEGVDELFFLDGVTGSLVRWLEAPATMRVLRSSDKVGTPWRNRVFFLASDASHGPELWVSDGTGEGTVPLEVTPGPAGADIRGPWVSPTAAWFLVVSPSEHRGLWRTDGSPAGTLRVAELEVTQDDPQLLAASDRVYVEPNPGELWGSDGTSAGTRLLVSFEHGSLAFPARLLGNGRLLFVFEDSPDRQLWTSDGTPVGTTRLVVGDDGTRAATGSDGGLLIGENLAYFRGETDAVGLEIWATDGTSAGTRPIDLCPGPCSTNAFPSWIDGDRLWFLRLESVVQGSVWRTDGELASTAVVSGLPPRSVGEVVGAVKDRMILFLADDSRFEELWTVPRDGATVASRLADFDAKDREGGSGPRDFWRQDGRVLFIARDDVGDQVWSTGGTATSTFSLWSLPGAGELPPPLGRLAVIGPWALATQSEGGGLGRQILRVATTDGAVSNLAGLVPPGGMLERLGFTVLGKRALYFELAGYLAAADPALGRVFELSPLLNFPADQPPTVVHRGAWFFTNSGQLWATDGTPQGTTRPFGEERISLVTATRDRLFLVAGSNDHLFATERLPNGSLAARVDLGPVGFAELATTDRHLFAFARTAASRQRGLVVSDGTPGGTRIVVNAFWPEVGEAVGFGDVLYFAAEEPQAGMELWRSDGTVEGTTRVADLHPGPAGSHPTNLRVLDGRLFFSASDGFHGNELWTSDGSAEGTVRLSDIAPGTRSSNPRNLAMAEGDLVFSANDGTTGREPWRFPLNELSGRPAVPQDLAWLRSAALPGFHFKVRFGGQGGVGGAVELACIAETVCVSGALPGRPEVFLRIVGPRANGYLWPTVVKFSTAEVEVWLEDEETGSLRFYRLGGARPGFDELPGLFDRRGFLPRVGNESAVAAVAAEGEEPPLPGTWFTSPALPGFRVSVAIASGAVPVRAERDCIAETLCVSGAVPGRAEVFVRVVGPKPNGFLWPTLVKFTTSELEVWIEQIATGQRQYYRIPGASPESDDLTGLFDRAGFRP